MRSFRLSFREKVDLRPGVVVALLIAIFAWHATIATVVCWWFLGEIPLNSPKVLNEFGWRSHSVESVAASNLCAAGILIVCEGLLAFALWRAARLMTRSRAPLGGFVLCWWRGCLIATVLIPLALIVSTNAFGSTEPGIFLSLPMLVVLPAAISGQLLASRQRWRPICPECGHSVLRAVVPRCSECGEEYPNPDPFYRRWAIRRLAWDQRKRTLLFAYISTVFCILFRPGYAAWHLSVPDRLGRAVRWVLGHFLLVAALFFGLLGGAWLLSSAWRIRALSAPLAGSTPADVQPEFTFAGVATWLGMWLFVWWIAAAIYPVLIATVLSAAAPGIHPAARRGMIKWALYLAVLPMLLSLFIGAAIALLIASISSPIFGSAIWNALYRTYYLYPARVLAAALMVWGVWWSMGVAAQPYLRRRGFIVFVGAFTGYLALWWLTATLLNLSGFEGLL